MLVLSQAVSKQTILLKFLLSWWKSHNYQEEVSIGYIDSFIYMFINDSQVYAINLEKSFLGYNNFLNINLSLLSIIMFYNHSCRKKSHSVNNMGTQKQDWKDKRKERDKNNKWN